MNAHFDYDTRYLTVEEVAERYSVSKDSIWRWKREGKFPLAVRVGPGCTRWRMSDLVEYDSKMTACCLMNASWLIAD